MAIGSGWISIKDEPPKDGQTVICKSADGIHESDFWMRGCRGNTKDSFRAPYYGQDVEVIFYSVTHWMPMPSFPNAEISGRGEK